MKGMLTFRKWLVSISAYAIPFVLCIVLLPHVPTDSGGFPDEAALSAQEKAGVEAFIFYKLRMPRVLLALIAGGALAMVGACFQVILRNPLAAPYTLGATGGATVGAVLAIQCPWLYVSIGPVSSVQLFALAGAGASLALIYRMARRPHGISMNTLLLAGVTISILSAGIVLFIRYLANPFAVVAMDRWMMGGLELIGYGKLGTLFPLFLPGLVLLLMQAPALNHLSLGEAMATGHGVEVARVQKLTFVGGGLVTAAVVSLTGPIGFVGLIVPHAVRRLSGFDQRIVLPASFLLGGAFLAVCDTGAQALYTPQGIPVGIVTALVGGPIFIKILLGRRR